MTITLLLVYLLTMITPTVCYTADTWEKRKEAHGDLETRRLRSRSPLRKEEAGEVGDMTSPSVPLAGPMETGFNWRV